MKYIRWYDSYLERLAQDGSRNSGLGSIHIVVLPFFLAIIFVSAIFQGLGWTNITAFIARILISLSLLICLFAAGFRFIHYSNKRDRE